MREDSFQTELDKIDKRNRKRHLDPKEEKEEQKRVIKQRLRKIEQRCQEELVSKYSSLRQKERERRVKQEMLGRRFNLQMSYLSLDAVSRQRVRQIVKDNPQIQGL